MPKVKSRKSLRKSIKKSTRNTKRKSTRNTKRKSIRKSIRKSKRKSIRKSPQEKKCRKMLAKKIAINMEEYRQGRFLYPKQAVAVSYSQVKKKSPKCRKYFS